MASKIGNISIVPDDPNELKKYGIYDLKNFDKIIESGAPFDYDFLLINGEMDNIFTEAIMCIFSEITPKSQALLEAINKPFHRLYKDISGLKSTDEYNAEIEETIFKWLSSVIEKLPGRIIIIGGKRPNDWEQYIPESLHVEDDNRKIRVWLCKRVVWRENLEGFEIISKEEQELITMYSITNPLEVSPFDLQLLLYYNWLKDIHTLELLAKTEFQVNLKKNSNDSEKISRNDVYNNIRKIKDNLKREGLIKIDEDEGVLYRRVIELFKDEEEEIEIDIILRRFKSPGRSLPMKERKSLKACFMNLKKKASKKMPSCFEKKYEEDTDKKLDFSFFFLKTAKTVKNTIKYCRHDNKFVRQKKFIYQENLSGNSIHFSILHNVLTGNKKEKKAELLFNLIENGLVKIVVADERIADYASHLDFLPKYKFGGITVLKGIQGLIELADEAVTNFYSSKELATFKDLKGDASRNKYDIFIIHQGILDKTGLTPGKIEEEIDRWKREYFSMVVVTSGRGTPATIPKNARFIPFSALESTLLTSDISKLTLVKVIYKSLSRRV
jgi:hypothetical protein